METICLPRNGRSMGPSIDASKIKTSVKRALKSGVAAMGFMVGLGPLAPADAAVGHITFQGPIWYGADYTGVFGVAPGSILINYQAVVEYTFDTNIGFTLASPDYSYAYGGGNWNSASPSLGATVTINGVTKSILGYFVGQTTVLSAPYGSSLYAAVSD